MIHQVTVSQAELFRLIALLTIIAILIGIVIWLWRDRGRLKTSIQTAVNNASAAAQEEAFRTRGRILEELRVESEALAVKQEEIIRQFKQDAIQAAEKIAVEHKEEIKHDLATAIKEIKDKIDEVKPPPVLGESK